MTPLWVSRFGSGQPPFGNLDRRAHADFTLLVRKGTFSQAKVSASRLFNLPVSC